MRREFNIHDRDQIASITETGNGSVQRYYSPEIDTPDAVNKEVRIKHFGRLLGTAVITQMSKWMNHETKEEYMNYFFRYFIPVGSKIAPRGPNGPAFPTSIIWGDYGLNFHRQGCVTACEACYAHMLSDKRRPKVVWSEMKRRRDWHLLPHKFGLQVPYLEGRTVLLCPNHDPGVDLETKKMAVGTAKTCFNAEVNVRILTKSMHFKPEDFEDKHKRFMPSENARLEFGMKFVSRDPTICDRYEGPSVSSFKRAKRLREFQEAGYSTFAVVTVTPEDTTVETLISEDIYSAASSVYLDCHDNPEPSELRELLNELESLDELTIRMTDRFRRRTFV